jgi:hypothetical protein
MTFVPAGQEERAPMDQYETNTWGPAGGGSAPRGRLAQPAG